MDAHWFAATKTEFRLRVIPLVVVFVAGYACYSFDHIPAGALVGRWLHSWIGGATEGIWVRAVFLVAAAVALLGAAIGTWAFSYVTSAVEQEYGLHPDKLVTDGPYRYVRNPLYFGNWLVAVGMGLTASRTGFFVMVVGAFVWAMRVSLREEAELRETQGDSYSAYCVAVPRLIPSLRPRVPPAGSKPNWAVGFLEHFWVWGFAAAVVLFALTFNPAVLQWVPLASFVVWGSIFAVRVRSYKKQTPWQAS
jgi:protein-S-isoprenylcysteine O-methyltransferase Ste14